jgi:hypothetical protein
MGTVAIDSWLRGWSGVNIQTLIAGAAGNTPLYLPVAPFVKGGHMRTAVRRTDISGLFWYLTATLVGSWSWLFYLLYFALR